ncbi:MAG: VOC family protein [Chloroflexi bacterium]|nr:VOC family protein [Chloroflexota bacterium]MBT6681747.1 VOC family protein [Chloroflexota bacterium]
MDVADLDRSIQFWGAVLGSSDPKRFGQYAFFPDVSSGVGLGLQQVPETKAGKGRTHLDIKVSDLESSAAAVITLGGSQVEFVKE